MTLGCYWGEPTLAAPAARPELETLAELSRTRAKPTMKDIAAAVAEQHLLPLTEMMSPSRRANISRARHNAFAVMYATKRYSLNQIGGFFGGKDHTTVLHGIRQHRKRIEAARA